MSDPEILFKGRRFRVERLVQTMPDGSGHVREVVRHPGAVVILPLLDDGRICFVRNYRVAVAQMLIELPAGTHQLALEPMTHYGTAGPAEAQEVTIGNGRNTYLLANFPDTHLVGKILTNQP